MLEYFFKEANKIFDPLDAIFKGANNKNLECWNHAFYRQWVPITSMFDYFFCDPVSAETEELCVC